MQNRVFVNVPCRPDFEAKLNAMAARKNISRAALMRLAASEYLEREAEEVKGVRDAKPAS